MFAGVSRGDRARLVLGEVVTGNYFTTLGVSARLGRTLLAADDAPDAPRTVVLSNRYWRREFGGEPSAVGRTLRIRGQDFTIVGVLDDAFTGMVPMLAPEIWVPVRFAEEVEPAGINEIVPSPTGSSRLDRRGQRWLFVKARLAGETSVEQARANVDVVAARLRTEHPQTNKDRRVTVRPTAATRLHPEADKMLAWVVSGTMLAVGLVLVIACANVAGMLLARAAARQHEIAIRLAVGAGRVRLVRQLLTESLILGVLGAGVGVLLASWLTRLLTTYQLPLPIALSIDLRLDARVLAFTAGVSLLTGVLAGLAPALRATRANLVWDLKGDTAGGRLRGRRWTMRDVLVVGQMAVTIVLLVTAGLLVRSLSAAQKANVGFVTDGLAIVSADTGMLRYTPERSRQYWSEVTRRIEAIPGVKGVATASRLPFSLNFNRTSIAVPGRQKAADEMGTATNSASVSPGYFSTLGIGVLEGRAFANSDVPGDRRVAIVSELFARTYWPNESAIGRTVYERTLNSGRAFEIVGVVANHTLQTVGETPQPAIYFASTQRPGGYNVIVARMSSDDDCAGEPDAGDARRARARFAAVGKPDDEGPDAGDAFPGPRRGRPRDGVQRPRAGAGGGRPLRHHRLCGRRTHARDRDPHGHRRAARDRRPPRAPSGPRAGSGWLDRRLAPGRPGDTHGGRRALRRQRRRPDRVGNGYRGTVGGRDGRQRRSRLPGGPDRSRAGAENLNAGELTWCELRDLMTGVTS